MKVAAIVPAYNEEHTVGSVLQVLLNCSLIDEVIVVSDGSKDGTVGVVKEYPVRIIELPENMGKGGAMKAGAKSTDCDVLLFVDADLVGLTTDHFRLLLEPVLSNKTVMSVGIFYEGRRSTDLAQKIAPSLSGQRAVLKDFFDSVPKLEKSRYGVEVALTQFAERSGVNIIHVPLPALSQVTKEEKLGLFHGLFCRIKMYWDIVRSLRL